MEYQSFNLIVIGCWANELPCSSLQGEPAPCSSLHRERLSRLGQRAYLLQLLGELPCSSPYLLGFPRLSNPKVEKFESAWSGRYYYFYLFVYHYYNCSVSMSW
jgi:hypothetical protein